MIPQIMGRKSAVRANFIINKLRNAMAADLVTLLHDVGRELQIPANKCNAWHFPISCKI